ncbi:MAG: hypothetical protein RLZZ44_1890 [Bacteroidota bacterium]|jgi:hypothetical protein
MNYQDIKNQQPILRDCFFAFGNDQFNEGIKKHNLEGQKIYRGMGGLYGTESGIKELLNFYSDLNDRIAKECNPQEVYDYEFDNHECSITCDDTDAMMIIVSTFTEEQSRNVKRKNGYLNLSIEELFSQMQKEVN